MSKKENNLSFWQVTHGEFDMRHFRLRNVSHMCQYSVLRFGRLRGAGWLAEPITTWLRRRSHSGPIILVNYCLGHPRPRMASVQTSCLVVVIRRRTPRNLVTKIRLIEFEFDVALRPTETVRIILLGTGSPRRPPRLSTQLLSSEMFYLIWITLSR